MFEISVCNNKVLNPDHLGVSGGECHEVGINNRSAGGGVNVVCKWSHNIGKGQRKVGERVR